MQITSGRKAGRPRDAEAAGAILDATRRLVVKHGYEAVTTNAIAEAAGVGKQTIYRWWATKGDLVLDAFLQHAELEVDKPQGGSVEDRVRSFIQRTFDALDQTGPAIRSLMAHAQREPAFRAKFRERFIAPRRAKLRSILVSSRAGSSAAWSADVDAAIIALYGAVWYRTLLDEPIDRSFARRLARIVVRGLDA